MITGGGVTRTTCGYRDVLTEKSNQKVTFNYIITYLPSSSSTTDNPANVSLSSGYINWGAVVRQYEDYPYRLNNFFFVNDQGVPYSATTTLRDILANKNFGTLADENGDNWFCFCGDGKLEVTLKSGHRNAVFRDITNSQIQYTTFEDSTRSSLVTNNTSFYVTDRKEFYLFTNQLTKKDKNGNHYFTLDLEQGMRVVSVELTNRQDKFVTPKAEMYENEQPTLDYDCATKGMDPRPRL
jgi:hypothetical protein